MPKMTVEQCIKASQRLLNQYSITGTEVPLTYNDSADDVARMIDLINDAQAEIATTARPIHEHTEIVVPEVSAGTAMQDITTDIGAIATQAGYDFNYGESILFTPLKGLDRRAIEAPEYKWIDRTVLAVPNQPAGTYRVEYQRFPIRLATNVLTMSTTEKEQLYATQLDNTQDTHEIIPYFVAAMIAVDVNPKLYYALYNVWETRLARLGMRPAHAVRTRIEDVYGFSNFHGVW